MRAENWKETGNTGSQQSLSHESWELAGDWEHRQSAESVTWELGGDWEHRHPPESVTWELGTGRRLGKQTATRVCHMGAGNWQETGNTDSHQSLSQHTGGRQTSNHFNIGTSFSGHGIPIIKSDVILSLILLDLNWVRQHLHTEMALNACGHAMDCEMSLNTRACLVCVAPLAGLDQCTRTTLNAVFLVKIAKWPWRLMSMPPIFNTGWENPKMHMWCKFGDSSSNLLKVIVRTSRIS